MISPAQSASLAWKETSEDLFMDLDDDNTDRLFTFEVHKTNEQDENVTMRAGFNVLTSVLTSDRSLFISFLDYLSTYHS